MIDPAKVCLFIPGHLKKFKLDLFERIGREIQRAGGGVIKGSISALAGLPASVIPIVGCTPELRPLIDRWAAAKRSWIYWDRGYARRVFATDLPQGDAGGYYRWHLNSFQMAAVRDVPGDRWASLKTQVAPWHKNGRHIVLAEPSPTYEKFHGIEGWTERMLAALRSLTGRPVVRRDKEQQRSGRKLHEDLRDAHCLVTHGSNAAVEATIMGCPVFVDHGSAAALVGLTDIGRIETPAYPDRDAWVRSLAYCQFNERELVDGTLWRLLA